MPDKLQNLSEKVIHIKSSSTEPNKQLPVKYLSEIITARVEEIMLAMIYEIQESGFADMLRSGIVVTGGCAKIANLGNLIYDISGFKVRIGHPKKTFSCIDCEGITQPSAATSLGLLINALGDRTVNCAVETTTSRIITEVETVNGREIKVEVVEEPESEPAGEVSQDTGIGEAGTEEHPQGTIWPEKEIEKVDRSQKTEKSTTRKGGIFNITFKINKGIDKIKAGVTNGLFDMYKEVMADDLQDKE